MKTKQAIIDLLRANHIKNPESLSIPALILEMNSVLAYNCYPPAEKAIYDTFLKEIDSVLTGIPILLNERYDYLNTKVVTTPIANDTGIIARWHEINLIRDAFGGGNALVKLMKENKK